jgi:hypothetical protein
MQGLLRENSDTSSPHNSSKVPKNNQNFDASNIDWNNGSFKVTSRNAVIDHLIQVKAAYYEEIGHQFPAQIDQLRKLLVDVLFDFSLFRDACKVYFN